LVFGNVLPKKRIMTKAELACELIKEKKGKLSKSKIADILVSRYPTEFPNKEQARLVVRRVTDSQGNYNRKRAKIKTEWKGLSLPEPEQNDYSKFTIKQKRIAILSDIHFPYYEKDALNAAIRYIKKWKPDCILLNGDIIDMYQLSSFERDPRQRGFKYELDMLRNFIVQLKDLFPKVKLVYRLGNHEDRYQHKILQRLPELVDLELFNFESVISANQLGVTVIGNKRIIMAGKLNIVHGHEFARGFAAPVNPARGFFLKAKSNVLGGHHHQISSHQEQDLNGNKVGAWSTGCLCELHPKYMPINNWSHGFATVEVSNTGSFHVNNITVIDGKII
jgi:predicted phosphodiesterase